MQLYIYRRRKEMQGSSHQLQQPFKLISFQLTGSCGTDSFLFRLHLTANSRCCNSTSYAFASGLLNLSPFFFFFFLARYPDLLLSPTIPPRPTGTGKEGLGGQTETMLNPLWLELELVMVGTSAEVPLPPDHEARFFCFFLQNSR